MTAYLIAEVDVHDPVVYEDYKALAATAVALYGGEYIARGGAAELLEGWPRPQRVVIIRFADLATIRAWHASPEYAKARAVRERAATSRFQIVDGL
ncbi:MAG: DUF1330 domain-containing protein [Anaerolineales bacterium]|nr:DUF1330 domain-containing protein [Anaerolineales bacterium]